MKFKKTYLFLTPFLIPVTSLAAGITDFIDAGYSIINSILIPLAFLIALLYFFWGVAQYIRSGAGDEKGAAEGRKVMIWGIVGLFIAASIWGIITFIRKELGIPDIQNVERPIFEDNSTNFIPLVD